MTATAVDPAVACDRVLAEEPALRQLLGEDLWRLASEHPAPLTQVEALSPLMARDGRRASFRLHFADGTVLKGRRTATPEQAARIVRLGREIGVPEIVPPARHAGCAILYGWSEGEVVDPTAARPRLLRDCGALHGRIHAIPVPPQTIADYGPAAGELEARTNRAAADLGNRGIIPASWVGRVAEVMASSPPAPAPAVGYCHGDLCPENVVRDRRGGLVLIDDETFSVNPLDYDLARTRYRWPMTRGAWDCYLAGYSRYRPAASFRADFLFWMVVVLVEAMLFRVTSGVADIAQAYGQLSALMGNRR